MFLKIAELEKITTNLVQFGEVVEAKHNRVKIKIEGIDADLITDFLPCLTQINENATNYAKHKIGSNALILAPLGDLSQAIVLGFIEKVANREKFIENKQISEFSDGAKLEYDTQTHELNISGICKIKLNGVNVEITGDLQAEDIRGSKIHTGMVDLDTHTHANHGLKPTPMPQI